MGTDGEPTTDPVKILVSYDQVEWSMAACLDPVNPTGARFTGRLYVDRQPYLLPEAIAAMRLCRTCPIKDACRRHGMFEADGIWGGTTPQTRFKGKKLRPEDIDKIGAP